MKADEALWEARRQANLLLESRDWAPGVKKWGKFNNIKFIQRASIYHDYLYFARESGFLNEPAYETSTLADQGWKELALEDAGWNLAKIALVLAAYPMIRAYGMANWPEPPEEVDELGNPINEEPI